MIRLSDGYTIRRAFNPSGKQTGWLVEADERRLFHFLDLENALRWVKERMQP